MGPDFADTELRESLGYVVLRSPCVPIIYFYRSTSPKRTALDYRDAIEIADNLFGMAVGALDQDTYLIWSLSWAELYPSEREARAGMTYQEAKECGKTI